MGDSTCQTLTLKSAMDFKTERTSNDGAMQIVPYASTWGPTPGPLVVQLARAVGVEHQGQSNTGSCSLFTGLLVQDES